MKTTHLLQLLLLSAIWGVSFLLIRIAGDSFPPIWVALLRCSSGAVLLWVVLLAGRRPFPRRPPRRLLLWLLFVALFNNAIPFSCFAFGERTIPSSTAAVVNATTPIWTLLITMLVHRGYNPIHATGRMVAGVLLSFAGVVMVVMGHVTPGESAVERQGLVLGVALVVCASLSYGIATVAAKSRFKGLDPIGIATAQLTLASLWLIPVALAGQHPVMARVSIASIAAIATLGLAGSGIAYILYFNLLGQISATQVAAVTYLLPIWGLFWGLLAHEAIGWTAYAGVAIVVCGLVLLNWKAKAPASNLR